MFFLASLLYRLGLIIHLLVAKNTAPFLNTWWPWRPLLTQWLHVHEHVHGVTRVGDGRSRHERINIDGRPSKLASASQVLKGRRALGLVRLVGSGQGVGRTLHDRHTRERRNSRQAGVELLVI